MNDLEVNRNEDQDRGVCKTFGSFYTSFEGLGEEGVNTSYSSAIRSEIIHRAELIRSSKSELDKSERYGYIYLTENLISHRLYIGQHKFPGLCCDWLDPMYLGSGQILMRALVKYGKCNFKCYLLENCISKEELNERESFWVNQYNATKSKLFYNIASGGYGFPWDGKTEDELLEIKSRISESLMKYYKTHSHVSKGIPLSEETKKRLSISLSGPKNPNYGKPRSEETRRKISKSNMGKKLSPEHLAKLSASLRGRTYSEEFRKQASIRNSGSGNPFYGKHHTEESIAKIKRNMPDLSGANNPFYGKHHSKEVIEHIRYFNLGSKMDKETMRFRNIPIRCIETGDVYSSAGWLVRNLLGNDCNSRMRIKWVRRLKASAKFMYDTGEPGEEVFGYHWCYTRERKVD